MKLFLPLNYPSKSLLALYMYIRVRFPKQAQLWGVLALFELFGVFGLKNLFRITLDISFITINLLTEKRNPELF